MNLPDDEEQRRMLRATIPGPIKQRAPPDVLDAYLTTLGPPLLITDPATGTIHKTADVLARAGVHTHDL